MKNEPSNLQITLLGLLLFPYLYALLWLAMAVL